MAINKGSSSYITVSDYSGNYPSYNNFTSGLKVSGRVYSSGDDEGIVVGFAANGWAGVILGGNSVARSCFYFRNAEGSKPFWRYNDGTTSFDISHPGKGGTIALTSDMPSVPNVPSWALASTKPSYTFAEITDKITHTNEFNFVPNSYNNTVYFNYRGAGDGTANVTKYIFHNGAANTTGRASVEAASFVKYGGTAAQFLKADGSVDSNTYLTTSSASGTYLPLSAGSGKALTSDLFLTSGYGIQYVGGVGMLAYKPSGWTGVNNTQWTVGATDTQGVIRSNNTNLIHLKNGTEATIWDSSNSNKIDVAWTVSKVTVAVNQGIMTSGSSYSLIHQDASYNTFLGTPDSVNTLRSSNSNLVHLKANTNYVIWDASNSNLTSVNWSCNSLTTNGYVYVNNSVAGGNVYLGCDNSDIFWVHTVSGYPIVASCTTVRRGANNSGVTLGTSTYPWAALYASAATINSAMTVAGLEFGHTDEINGAASSSKNVHINYRTTGYTTLGYGGGNVGVGTASPAYRFHVSGNTRFVVPNFTDFQILRANSAGSAAITYYPGNQTTNYWAAGADPGTSYQFFWYYNGAYKAYLSTGGTLTTTGDQVISSDETLKENLSGITYTVDDIAKARAVTFDWKDGRGRSAGSIAQDWKDIIPELVHGEEGSMSLAYGQLGVVNSIILARELKKKDMEISELKEKIELLSEKIEMLLASKQ